MKVIVVGGVVYGIGGVECCSNKKGVEFDIVGVVVVVETGVVGSME